MQKLGASNEVTLENVKLQWSWERDKMLVLNATPHSYALSRSVVCCEQTWLAGGTFTFGELHKMCVKAKRPRTVGKFLCSSVRVVIGLTTMFVTVGETLANKSIRWMGDGTCFAHITSGMIASNSYSW